MTDNVSGHRAEAEATRVPPVDMESLKIHPIAADMPTSPNPALPADAGLDAVFREIMKRMAAGGRLEKVVHRLYILSNMFEGFEQMLYDPTNKVGAIDMMVQAQSAMCALITFAETNAESPKKPSAAEERLAKLLAGLKRQSAEIQDLERIPRGQVEPLSPTEFADLLCDFRKTLVEPLIKFAETGVIKDLSEAGK